MPFPANVVATGHFLKTQVTKTLPRLYETNYSDFWGLDPSKNYHAGIGDLPIGLDFLEAYYKSDAGQMASLYDGNSDDIPTVELSLGKKTFPCAIFVQGANWNLLQVEKFRVAQQLGQSIPSLNIVTAKQDLVADYFNRRENYTALYGYPKVGLRGILSLAGIATTDATFAPYRKSAGAYILSTATLYEDLIDIIYAFMARARLSSPNQVQIKIPPRLGRRMVEIYKTTAGESIGMTLNQMIQSTELGLGVASVEVHNELAGAELNKYVLNESSTGYYSSTSDRIVLKAVSYRPERHFYARRPFTPYQRSTLEYEQITIGSSSGILNFEEEKIMYYDFSNALV